jgi:hypothetical protein
LAILRENEFPKLDKHPPKVHLVHLMFHAGIPRKDCGYRRIKGTLADMVRDRLRFK